MLSVMLTRCINSQWSSCGSAVHLVDRDPAQLRDAKVAFEQFKQDGIIKSHKGGELRTFVAEDRESAFEGVWLVVEVRTLFQRGGRISGVY